MTFKEADDEALATALPTTTVPEVHATRTPSPEEEARRRHARAARELRKATDARQRAEIKLDEAKGEETAAVAEEKDAWAAIQTWREAAAKRAAVVQA